MTEIQHSKKQQQPHNLNDEGQKIITWNQYSNHITGQDCWVLIDGYLYDVSDYLVQHPGGDDILLKYSGIDASRPFNDQQHSQYAKSLRNARKVGKIQSPIYTEQYRLMLQQKKRKLKEAKKLMLRKQKTSQEKKLTLQQVSQHNNDESCWIIIDRKVYDVTSYMSSHPGGEGLILDKAGKDATVAFKQANHSLDAIQKRDEFLIGSLVGQTGSKTSNLVVIVFGLIVLSIIGYFAASNFM